MASLSIYLGKENVEVRVLTAGGAYGQFVNVYHEHIQVSFGCGTEEAVVKFGKALIEAGESIIKNKEAQNAEEQRKNVV